MSGSFFNNTAFLVEILVKGDAIVRTVGDVSSGNWTGTGVNWTGSPDLSSWTVTLDVPKLGIKGKIPKHSLIFSRPRGVRYMPPWIV